jgi:Tfp pilus assembly PilM family ATPase
MTPSFLAPAPPSIAIEIASRRVTVAEVRTSGGQTAVSAHASESLPGDAVTPALSGTNISNPAGVADALRRAFERAGLGSPRRAALIVPDTIARVSLLPFEQPPARPAELDQLIRWQLRKSTPFPLEEARVEHVLANTQDRGATFAAIVARQDVLAQYEAVTAAAGVHAGIVDLASFNVMNAVMASGGVPAGDWLLVCLPPEGTTIAILRGTSLLFYRHRTTIDEEPLSALVHQTAMYHEDRLGGTTFERVLVSGAALAGEGDRIRREIGERLGVAVEPVDVRSAAPARERLSIGPDMLDALAGPVGVLMRER